MISIDNIFNNLNIGYCMVGILGFTLGVGVTKYFSSKKIIKPENTESLSNRNIEPINVELHSNSNNSSDMETSGSNVPFIDYSEDIKIIGNENFSGTLQMNSYRHINNTIVELSDIQVEKLLTVWEQYHNMCDNFISNVINTNTDLSFLPGLFVMLFYIGGEHAAYILDTKISNGNKFNFIEYIKTNMFSTIKDIESLQKLETLNELVNKKAMERYDDFNAFITEKIKRTKYLFSYRKKKLSEK